MVTSSLTEEYLPIRVAARSIYRRYAVGFCFHTGISETAHTFPSGRRRKNLMVRNVNRVSDDYAPMVDSYNVGCVILRAEVLFYPAREREEK